MRWLRIRQVHEGQIWDWDRTRLAWWAVSVGFIVTVVYVPDVLSGAFTLERLGNGMTVLAGMLAFFVFMSWLFMVFAPPVGNPYYLPVATRPLSADEARVRYVLLQFRPAIGITLFMVGWILVGVAELLSFREIV